MSFSTWLRNRTSKRPADHPAASRRAAWFRPQLESLDDRLVPSTLIVTNNLGFGTGSLRDEINSAQSGDTIIFASNLSGQIIQLASNNPYGSSPIELLVTKNLTIQGPIAGLTIDANNVARAFEIASGAHVTISGLTIADGNGKTGAYDPSPTWYYGGGILNEGTLTLNGCVVNGNIAGASGIGWGGGVANFGTMTMSGCWVTGNTAGNAGGGVYNTGALTVTGSTVVGNTALYVKYDDIDNTGTLSVSNSTIGSKKYK
jgi:hypothetical protein